MILQDLTEAPSLLSHLRAQRPTTIQLHHEKPERVSFLAACGIVDVRQGKQGKQCLGKLLNQSNGHDHNLIVPECHRTIGTAEGAGTPGPHPTRPLQLCAAGERLTPRGWMLGPRRKAKVCLHATVGCGNLGASALFQIVHGDSKSMV